MAFFHQPLFRSKSKQDHSGSGASPNTEESQGSGSTNFLFKEAKKTMKPAQQDASVNMSTQNRMPSSALLFGDVVNQIPLELIRPHQVPPTQALEIPSEVLHQYLSRGATSLPLHEIYKACPEAFQSPIAAQDPRTVSIPPTKLVGLITQLRNAMPTPTAAAAPSPLNFSSSTPQPKAEAKNVVISTFSNLPPPSRNENNTFNVIPKKKTVSAEAPEPSPFQQVEQNATVSSPFNKVAEPERPSPFSLIAKLKEAATNVAPESVPAEEPSFFQKVIPNQQEAAPPEAAVESPFSIPTSSHLPVEQEISPAPSPFMPAAAIAPQAPASQNSPAEADQNNSLSLGVASLLSKVPPHQLGISHHQIPEHLQVDIPIAALKNQLHQGVPGMSMRQLKTFLSSSQQSLLERANPDAFIELPVNSLYHKLTQPSWNSADHTSPPFIAQAEKTPANSPPNNLEAFPQLPELPSNLPEAPQETPSLDFLPAPEVSQKENAPLVEQISHEVIDPAPTAPVSPLHDVFTPDPTSATPLPMIVSANPANSTLEINPVSAPSRIKQDQLIWRVLLGAKQDLDLHGILVLARQQLSLVAIAAIKDGKIISSDSDEIAEAKTYLTQTPLICEHLQSLIQLTGIQDTETFSIKHHQYMQTFSAQPNFTLAVMYTPPADEASLKEKITLIARELAHVIS